MAETVFVFGAGASREGGAPVMSNFMQEAERVLTGTNERGNLDQVLNFLDDCKSLHSYANLDLDNLETLYGIAEMARVTRRFQAYKPDQIDAVVSALNYVIAVTIEKTLAFPATDRQVSPPTGYDELAQQLRDSNKSTSFITFNYDLGLDYALYFYGLPFDYCLGSAPTNAARLIKLHGSLNWFICPECKQAIPWTLRDFFSKRSWQLYTNGEKHLTLSQLMNEAPHSCQAMPEQRRPLIVPPTWNKPAYQTTLGSVWASAADALSDVRDLIIVGFSLPETDLFFRYLYSVGSASARLRSIRVFDPNSEVKGRFEALLGVGAKPKFRFQRATFLDAVRLLPDIE